MQPPATPDPMSSMWAWLAHDLHFYRVRAKMTGETFGKIMGVVRSTVSRFESGEYKIKEKHADALDAYFNTGGHFRRLLEYAKLGHDPDWFKSSLEKEAEATLIKAYQGSVLHGLVQTRAYASALFAVGGWSPGAATRLVEERIARQEIFDREMPAELWMIVTECVLHQLFGGREVMKEQLAHLLELSERPNFVIRVIPLSAGAYDGADGPFTIVACPSGDVAYAEAFGGGRLVSTADEVRQFGLKYERIGHLALTPELSRKLIGEIMEAM